MGGALDIVKSFGPTPLDELTARATGNPEEIAQEINRLTKEDLLKVSDKGKTISQISPEEAESASFLVELSPAAIKQSLPR